MRKRLCFLILFNLALGLVLTDLSKGADPTLVGWWKLDESEGTVAADSSGNGNDDTLHGDPQWITGQINGALEFD
jgi:hypothetical protein